MRFVRIAEKQRILSYTAFGDWFL